MAVGTGNASFEMGASGCEDLIIRMLRFQHGSTGVRVCPVCKTILFVIVQYIFDLCAILPWHGQHFILARHVILIVAIRTNHCPHFLPGEFGPIDALGFKTGDDCRICHDKAHGARFMAVRTANGLVDLFAQFGKWHLTEFFQTDLIPYARGYWKICRNNNCRRSSR